MASSGGKTPGAPAAPPRKIFVQKFAESRAPEFDSLISVVKDRTNNNLKVQLNERRRTGSYRKLKNFTKKRKLGLFGETSGPADKEHNKKVPRRVRRRMELKGNPESGFTTSGDGTKRLRTHMWHVKRFTMTKRWGFYLPLGLHGKGRGSRAVLRWFQNGAVVHDSSYNSVVQLEVLRLVLVPSPSTQPKDILDSIQSGAVYGTAMLHHAGAPLSRAIVPVTYMWRPSHLVSGDVDTTNHTNGGCDKAESSQSCSSDRQLWILIHASAFCEGFNALKFACQKQMTESGIPIQCFSLEGQLGKLDIIGPKAFQLLQRILHPVSCGSEASWELGGCSVVEAGDDAKIEKSSLLESEDNISYCSVLSVTVKDPRTVGEKKTADTPESASVGVLNGAVEDNAKKQVRFPVVSVKNGKLLPASCSKPESSGSFASTETLWDARRGVSPPLQENVLCLEKHFSRLDFLCLDDPTLEMPTNLSELQGSRTCPILLLKNNNCPGLHMGWSVIMPLSWTRVFWNSIVLKGANTIGQREKRWIACNVGLPNFPSDFPDCSAYEYLMASEGVALDQQAERLPPSVKPFKVPIPPPWNTVRVAADNLFQAPAASNRSTKVLGDPISSEEQMSEENLLADSSSRHCGPTSDSGDGSKFDGFVARTSAVLNDFLKENHGSQLLFPEVKSKNTRSPKFTIDESKLGGAQNGLSPIAFGRRLCFLRVLLHAVKEGVFEEGAVVCAPLLSDIPMRTFNYIEDGLQIPESSVRSYFKEQHPSKWELQIPQDPAAMESHRWPIGFVTTGFVRGSKKPVAVAMCEAGLLARLREEQWNKMPEKRERKETLVLVRNLRSTAYRLARATVVLEQQEEDLEFFYVKRAVNRSISGGFCYGWTEEDWIREKMADAKRRHWSIRSGLQNQSGESGFEGGDSSLDLKKADLPRYAILETSKGFITVELFKDSAPGVVDKFIDLCEKGHFKNMRFHRVIKHYVIQAGVAGNPGATEDDWTLRGKHYSQLDTSLKHEAFMLGTSKGKHDDKGFELFITTAPIPDLNEKLMVFGRVTKGEDVVQEIEEVDTDEHFQPKSRIDIVNVTLKQKI
ncbi:hypothetical protein Tsubulata_046920 [Turnera subulata]|uniref:PPIase cyclophilin-type domain-containing protein n=1 Tax=Turnera subulata TaxID=218843 RepID=A0A9Q0JNT0_9ROSI|nr:hypothetical protein Tsubulata_046920 [Turnera subulata]